MAAVDGSDLGDAQPFGGDDDRGVDGAQREVVVAGDELGDPQRIGGVDRLNDELARGEVAEEAHLGLPTQAGVEQVGDLGDDKCRDDQGTWVRFQ